MSYHIFIFIPLLLLVNTELKSQELVTDRPDQAESSVTIPKKHLQIETGFLTEQHESSDFKYIETTYNTTLLRYGLFDKFELRLGMDYKKSKQINTGLDDIARQGLTPITVGGKYAINQQKGAIPEMALLGHYTFPNTSGNHFYDQYIRKGLIWALSYSFSEKISIGANLGFETFFIEQVYIYALVYGHSISDKIAGFIETYGEIDAYRNSNYIDAGVTYLLRPNLQFDASFGLKTTTSITTYYFISLGLSLRIPK